MMPSQAMTPPVCNDSELVARSLAGNREAFGQIVARYQSLVCSLAYSATGDLGRSEDLAQETFLTAWKQLRGLNEPGKLRAWLCGIARNLTNSALRRQGREPTHAAETLDAAGESPASEPLPSDQAVSREEAAILWRSLERIPETYREPLILFYREHQSIENVALALDLSEDAVRQRLSRGRKLMQDHLADLVEGTLARSGPGTAFTLQVMSALPILATSSGISAASSLSEGRSRGEGGVAGPVRRRIRPRGGSPERLPRLQDRSGQRPLGKGADLHQGIFDPGLDMHCAGIGSADRNRVLWSTPSCWPSGALGLDDRRSGGLLSSGLCLRLVLAKTPARKGCHRLPWNGVGRERRCR
jgi:RNA polymerase sigma factor (sigma-70 family)